MQGGASTLSPLRAGRLAVWLRPLRSRGVARGMSTRKVDTSCSVVRAHCCVHERLLVVALLGPTEEMQYQVQAVRTRGEVAVDR